MSRAIIGTGTGYGSAPKVRLDDDCGARTPCSPCAGGAPGPGEDDGLSAFPVLQVLLRKRIGYDDDGVAMFDWITMLEGRAFVYEQRKEVDAEAGATLIHMRAILPNRQRLDHLPETSVVQEVGSDVRWEIDTSAVLPDRVEVTGHRVWREVPGPAPTFDREDPNDPLAGIDF